MGDDDKEDSIFDFSDKIEVEEELSDLAYILRHERGRRYITGLIEKSGTLASQFNPTAMVMAKNTGRADFGREILNSVLQVSPGIYVTMLKERGNG